MTQQQQDERGRPKREENLRGTDPVTGIYATDAGNQITYVKRDHLG